MAESDRREIPGEVESGPGTNGIWTFVFIDMIVFLMLFVVYLAERHRLHDIFVAAQHQLTPWVALLSTGALLTSSWCMAEAVHAERRNAPAVVRKWLTFALLLGAFFIVNKLVEYGGKFAHGITPTTNGFYTFYFLITGLHLIHVCGGMVFIGHCRSTAAAEVGSVNYARKIENVGLFWHFVDILWLFIFPMLYLAELV